MVVFAFIFAVVVAEDVDSVDALVEEVVLNAVVVLGMLCKVRIWIVLWFLASNSFDEFCTKDFVTNDSVVLDFALAFADSVIGLALSDIFASIRLLLTDAPIDTFEAVFPRTRFPNLDF